MRAQRTLLALATMAFGQIVYSQDLSNDLEDVSTGKSSAEAFDLELLNRHRLGQLLERSISEANAELKKNPEKAVEWAERAEKYVEVTPVSDYRFMKAKEVKRLLDACEFETLKATVKKDGVKKTASYVGKVEEAIAKNPELRLMTVRHAGTVPKWPLRLKLYLFKDDRLVAKATVRMVYKEVLVADVEPQWYEVTKNAELLGCEVWGILRK